MTRALLPTPGSYSHAVLTGIAGSIDISGTVILDEAKAARAAHGTSREARDLWLATTQAAMYGIYAWVLASGVAAVLLIQSGNAMVPAALAGAAPVAATVSSVLLGVAERARRKASTA